MDNIITIEELPEFIDMAIAKVNEGVALARRRGILAELPKEVQFDVTLVTKFQTLTIVSKDGSVSNDVSTSNGTSTSKSDGTRTGTESSTSTGTGSDTRTSEETSTGSSSGADTRSEKSNSTKNNIDLANTSGTSASYTY